MVTARTTGTATARDLLALGDRAAEVIDGHVVDKAAPGPEHGDAQLGIGAALAPFRRPGKGGGEPGGWWIMAEVEVHYEEHQVFRHDLVGWRRERSPVRPQGRPVVLRPDWACEVLSPSNTTNDTVRKFRVLHAHGVPHYWLVDPDRKLLTVYRYSADGYISLQIAEDGERIRAEPFDAVELDLGLLFDDGK